MKTLLTLLAAAVIIAVVWSVRKTFKILKR